METLNVVVLHLAAAPGPLAVLRGRHRAWARFPRSGGLDGSAAEPLCFLLSLSSPSAWGSEEATAGEGEGANGQTLAPSATLYGRVVSGVRIHRARPPLTPQR